MIYSLTASTNHYICHIRSVFGLLSIYNFGVDMRLLENWQLHSALVSASIMQPLLTTNCAYDISNFSELCNQSVTQWLFSYDFVQKIYKTFSSKSVLNFIKALIIIMLSSWNNLHLHIQSCFYKVIFHTKVQEYTQGNIHSKFWS